MVEGLVSCYLGMGWGFGWKCIVWWFGLKGMTGWLLGVSGGTFHG